MADINLLSSAAKKDELEKGTHGPKDDEMKLHVPAPEPEAPADKRGSGLVPSAKPTPVAPEPSASLLSQKLAPISVPPAPKPVPPPPLPKMVVPPPKPPAPRAPSPLVPPPKPPMPPKPPKPTPSDDSDGGGTLRVSLITSGAGAALSEIALMRKLRSFLLIGLLGLVFDGMIYGALLYQKSAVEKKNAAAEQQIGDIDGKISALEKDLAPVRDFQQLVRTEKMVLDNHEHWTGVLKLLEETALPEVQFGSLAGADTGALSFEVFARDYTTLAKQIVAFRNDHRVLKVTTGTASADFGENGLLKGVRSEMTLTVDPKVFKFDAQTAAQAQPQKDTQVQTQTSAQALPPAL